MKLTKSGAKKEAVANHVVQDRDLVRVPIRRVPVPDHLRTHRVHHHLDLTHDQRAATVALQVQAHTAGRDQQGHIRIHGHIRPGQVHDPEAVETVEVAEAVEAVEVVGAAVGAGHHHTHRNHLVAVQGLVPSEE